MTRDVRQDPRPGDVVQVHPPLGEKLPAPLTVTSVEYRGVRWYRAEQGENLTRWSVWRGERRFGTAGVQLQLVQGSPS